MFAVEACWSMRSQIVLNQLFITDICFLSDNIWISRNVQYPQLNHSSHSFLAASDHSICAAIVFDTHCVGSAEPGTKPNVALEVGVKTSSTENVQPGYGP